jgi:tetratricopeptide (TPR) repeat protein
VDKNDKSAILRFLDIFAETKPGKALNLLNQIRADDEPVWFDTVGMVYFYNGHFRSAIDWFDRAIQISSILESELIKSNQAIYFKARSLLGLNRYEDAVRVLCLGLQHKCPSCLKTFSQIFSDDTRSATEQHEAIKIWSELINETPGDALFTLATRKNLAVNSFGGSIDRYSVLKEGFMDSLSLLKKGAELGHRQCQKMLSVFYVAIHDYQTTVAALDFSTVPDIETLASHKPVGCVEQYLANKTKTMA